jgi:WD40 repeat protein
MFSPDSRYLAVASTPRLGFVRVWDLAADPPTARDLRVNGTVSSFSPDGRYLASMDAGAGPATHPLSDASITWWTTDGWQKAGNLTIGRDENNYRLDAMFAADGRLAVYSGDPLRVFLIDPATSERWDLPLPAQGCTFQRTMSSRRGLLAVSCDPPRDSVWQRFCDRVERWGLSIPWGRDAWGVHLIQLDTGREYGCIPGASASLSHWSPDGRLLAVKAVNGAIALWDVPPRPSVLLWEAAALTIAIPVAGFAVWRVRRLRQPVRGTV